MRGAIFRFLHRLVVSILLSASLLSLPGVSLSLVRALTTTASDFGPVSIPDASCITRNITAATNVIIADINIRLNISHIQRSDVRATLTSPAGTTVVLISGGGQGSPVSAISPDAYDNYDVTLDDTSTGSIYDNSNDNVAGGADRTARPHELLSAFKGENSVGATPWVLAVCDTLANGISGTYNLATLTFTSASANTVNGTVYIDYNQNGIRGAGDTGVGGVQVRAYNSAGAQVAAATTNSGGGYSLSITNGTQVRLEFTNIPANLRPGAFGRESGTTVQFVTSPLWGVDLGLSSPDDYCQNNPFLVMPCYINGDPLAGGSAGAAEVMVSIPNSAYGRSDVSVENSLATGSQIGATWGLAYQRTTHTLFASAIAKRHAGFGPLGGGGIYAIAVDPVTGASLSVTNFVDIDLFAGVDDGALDDTARNLPANSSVPNEDPAAWDAAGKEAIGDMDIGTDDDTLWLVNLADRTLYSLFVGIPAVAPAGVSTATPITLPAGATACPASDVRPWAVEVYRGNVYVGVVCSAESSQNVNNLRAYILSTPESSPGAWTLALEFALNYPRGVASADGSGYPAEWRPWSSAFTSICESPCTPGLAFSNQIIYPQPIVADIEFDTDGDMIIGLMDRLGHQTGEANFATSSGVSTFTFYNFSTGYTQTSVTIAAGAVFEGTSAGDILRVCTSGGGFALESNASCGGITTGGAGNGQGPNNGEYYWQDMFVQEGFPASTVSTSGTHHEVTLGGLVLFPGTDEVATAVFDPFAIRSGGITWFSNTTGTRTRAYEIFPQTDTPDRFGKAAGLGDIEGFCYQTPIEIGNRVWIDTDGDGVQDAGETPIAGVTVELYQGNTLIATAVTDVNGTYYFSSGPGTSSSNQIYFLDDLDPNASYEIRIPNAQGGSQQGSLAGLALSPPNVNSGTNFDLRDSDASYSGNDAIISITTGDLGDNDHTFDFGFTSPYSLGNRVWFDTNNNALVDAGEIGVAGVRVELFRDNGTAPGAWDAGDTFLSFETTDASGYYRFDNLAAGEYVVLLPDDNFRDVGAGDTVPGDPLAGYWSSLTTIAANGVITDATANDPDTTLVDSDDNGRTTLLTATQVNYVASAAVTLGPGSAEPTGETDPVTNPEVGEAPDNRSDRTVDFGFYRTVVGDLVFEDNNADGDYDVGIDAPLAGAMVQLFASDGTTEINVGVDGIVGTADDLLGDFVTGPLGTYNFIGLPQGDYIVRVTPPVGYSSTVDTADAADTTDPDTNTDNNDNGIGLAGGAVSSGMLTMIPAEVAANITVNSLDGSTTDLTVDFGFVRAYSLGNRVWFDTNNNSTRDAGELGVDGILVELYAADASGNPTGAALSTATTAGGGYYRFDNLLAGDYVVVIASDNFISNGSNDALVGYWSSGTSRLLNGTLTESAAPDADADASDTDDNGTLQTGGAFSGAVLSAAVTLGPGGSEPTGETDLSGGQGATDDRADMTVDFGFYTMTLGDRVWADTNDDGLLSGEIGINGVDLELLSGDATTVLATTTTAGNGNYSFTGLPAGDYIVRIAAAEFNVGGTLAGRTSSSGGGTYEPAPDSDVNTSDNDDNGTVNGVLGAGGVIQTEVITLTPGAEATSNNATGVTNEPRVDLGVVTGSYSLGNRVWFDTDNNSTRDAINEVGVDGVIVHLYAADGAGNPTGLVLATTTTAGGGYYRFDNLPEGDYVVVLPADNFTVGGSSDALVGYWSSGTTINNAGAIGESAAPDPDTNLDDDDNGTRQAAGAFSGAVMSGAVTLGPGVSEPVGETDPATNPLPGEAIDDHSNRTVDFGFYRLQLGNLIFEDLDNDGSFSAGDTPIQNAVVQLFAADGVTEINVGPDGILGTADDAAGGVTTGAGGTYQFSGLPQGDYIVRVTPPAVYLSTIDSFNQADNDDANTNADNNDNGDGILSGTVSSSIVSLVPGGAGALNNNIVTQVSGTTNNPTLDFGFIQEVNASGLTKILLSSNQAFTTDPDVAIGEIVTYRVSITIPTGTFTNARIVDTLERGLSFMDCTSITAPGLTTSVPGGFTDICANPTVDDAGGGTTTDVQRRVTYDFGTLSNVGAPQTLIIEYRAVVLDSAGNVSGVDLDNSVVWSSDVGPIGPQATTVTIVEADVSIVKAASTTVVAVGDVITITLTIDHTAASETDAYDLVITDALPAELDFVPGTLDCNAGVQPADVGSCQYVAGTRTITGTWTNFALGGGNAVITFDVTVLAIPATNVGSVAWTSLPGIPPSPPGNPPGQQNANIFSTERGYDPGDPIDIYGASSTLVLGTPPPPGGGGGAGTGRSLLIPDTGFAPSTKTDLSAVPLETYSTLAESIWMEIPSLRVKSLIVGVPQRNGAWNVAWLSNQAGWLSGTAFPTLEGNSVVTGHVYLPSGLPGPFVNVSQLKFGDQVIVHFGGQKYIYEVRSNRVTNPTDASVFRHDEESWITLITCKEYDQVTDSYRKRVIIRAVLVKIEADR